MENFKNITIFLLFVSITLLIQFNISWAIIPISVLTIIVVYVCGNSILRNIKNKTYDFDFYVNTIEFIGFPLFLILHFWG